jgi:glycosyltransferase involved in cell wall biosynthesis
MAQLYRTADLFVLGSLKEMMPIAILEAAASGLPCLVNAHPVMQWMVGPGGLSLDLSAPGGLSRALEQLGSDSDRRRQLGQLARQYCLEHFRRDRVVDQILQYYQFVAATPPSRGQK